MEEKKTPLGIIPEKIWKDRRISALSEAINRYTASGMIVPVEWIKEYNNLCIESEKAVKAKATITDFAEIKEAPALYDEIIASLKGIMRRINPLGIGDVLIDELTNISKRITPEICTREEVKSNYEVSGFLKGSLMSMEIIKTEQANGLELPIKSSKLDRVKLSANITSPKEFKDFIEHLKSMRERFVSNEKVIEVAKYQIEVLKFLLDNEGSLNYGIGKYPISICIHRADYFLKRHGDILKTIHIDLYYSFMKNPEKYV